jgi:fumarate reductase subunit C
VSPLLFVAQRVTAVVLAFAVAAHLGTILYTVRGGLTAADILARTHGNLAFALFYGAFVVAVAIHAPIGLRNVLREWTRWRGTTLDLALALFAILLLGIGLRAVFAVFTS